MSPTVHMYASACSFARCPSDRPSTSPQSLHERLKARQLLSVENAYPKWKRYVPRLVFPGEGQLLVESGQDSEVVLHRIARPNEGEVQGLERVDAHRILHGIVRETDDLKGTATVAPVSRWYPDADNHLP